MKGCVFKTQVAHFLYCDVGDKSNGNTKHKAADELVQKREYGVLRNKHAANGNTQRKLKTYDAACVIEKRFSLQNCLLTWWDAGVMFKR